MMDDKKFGPGYGQGHGSGFAPGYVPASGPGTSLPEPPIDDMTGPAGDDVSAAPVADEPGADPSVEKFR